MRELLINLINKTMDINEEIEMEDLKYKVKELQEKNEELQVKLEILEEQLTLKDVGCSTDVTISKEMYNALIRDSESLQKVSYH